MSDNLTKLYEKYNALSDAKEKVSQHSKEYLESFEGIKGNESEKMLAAQILSKFFKHFPNIQDQALNALLDLCEDDESRIRACAMRYLVSICKEAKEHVAKVTDILAQMLQIEDGNDFQNASKSLIQLYKEDPINVVKAMYNHIHSLNDTPAREKCVLFFHSKIIRPIEEQSSDIEAIVIEESKKVLQDSSTEESLAIISTLKHSKLTKTISGQLELLEILAEEVGLDHEFDPLEEGSNNVDRVVMCVNYALPFFSSKNESTKFLVFYCDQVLPQWEKIATLKDGEIYQLQLLQQLAELSNYCGKLENPSLYVVQIFDKMKLYMPPPPEDADLNKMPNLEFSFVECLLYAFHKLARQCPDFLTHDQEVLKDFRARLTYFSRGVQGCNKVLIGKSFYKVDQSTAIKAKIAPSLLSNINLLIRDLYHMPPMYKCNVSLSFKTELDEKDMKRSSNTSHKRHIPITFDGGNNGTSTKQSRSSRSGENVKLYTPPSGKFSNNFQNDRSSGRGNRPRGRSSRRPSGRNWRN